MSIGRAGALAVALSAGGCFYSVADLAPEAGSDASSGGSSSGGFAGQAGALADAADDRDAGVDASLDPDLVAWWRFDEGAGNVASDSTANANHGALNSGVSWVAGELAGAAAFDGTTGRVSVPDSPSISALTNALTVSLWIYLDSIGPLPPQNQPRVLQAGTWEVKLNASAPQFSSYPRYAIMDFHLPTGQWHHVAFTFEAQAAVTGYLNGLPHPFGTDNFSDTSPLLASGDGISLGNALTEPDVACHCRLDDVRIYRRVLSADEIAALAQ